MSTPSSPITRWSPLQVEARTPSAASEAFNPATASPLILSLATTDSGISSSPPWGFSATSRACTPMRGACSMAAATP